MRITVGMLKGGVSRTTTAIYLALAEHARSGGRVLLVDVDGKNGTAFEWAEDAQADGWPAGVQVRYWPTSRLAKRVTSAIEDEGYDSVVVDTGNDEASLRAGLEVSDFLLVPLAPSGTESTRLTPTLEAAADVGLRAGRSFELAVLLTRTVPRTHSARDARAGLKGLDLRVLDTEIPRLERFATAYGKTPRDLEPYATALEELHEINKTRGA